MKPIHSLVSAGAVALTLLLPVSSRAESGTVEILLPSVSTVGSVQIGDTTVTARIGTGTITFTKSSGGPFVEGASGNTQFASFSKKTPTGFDLEADGVATLSSDDTLLLLFKRKTGDLAAGTSAEGILQLLGGTGRFSGVSGQCKYSVAILANTWSVTAAKCQWSR